MMRAGLMATMVAVAMTVAACATAPPPVSPFKISQGEFQQRIRIIALGQLNLPDAVDDPAKIRSMFESRIEDKLRSAGFTVIKSAETTEIWNRIVKQLGGSFDPNTGRRDPEKFKLLVEDFRREVHDKFQADAILFPRLVSVSAPWAGKTAKWHGTADAVKTTGSFVAEAFFGMSTHGRIGALSLAARIEDIAGVLVYEEFGGIQVLSKVSGRNFVPVPPTELLVDQEKNCRGVDLALAPLLQRSGEPASKEK